MIQGATDDFLYYLLTALIASQWVSEWDQDFSDDFNVDVKVLIDKLFRLLCHVSETVSQLE